MKREELIFLISPKVRELGFKKEKYTFTYQINENFYGTLGFMIATKNLKGHAFISPTIGIFYIPLEELYCKLSNYNSIETFQATISCLIYRLMPVKYAFEAEWDFIDNIDNTKTLESMIKEVKIYAFDFYKKHSTEEVILNCLESQTFVNSSFKQSKLPLMYYLLGQKAKALEYVNSLNKNDAFLNHNDYLNKLKKFLKNN